ncbi:hypothetical protein ACFQ4K_05925 [Tistrella bauzanensis]
MLVPIAAGCNWPASPASLSIRSISVTSLSSAGSPADPPSQAPSGLMKPNVGQALIAYACHIRMAGSWITGWVMP